MGRDATVYIPNRNSKKEISDFLIMLGYEKYGNTYYYYDMKGNTTLSGVYAWISLNKEENKDKYKYSICIRTYAMANSNDIKFHNNTLRQFRKRFSAIFQSDRGKNRYYEVEEEDIYASNNACVNIKFASNKDLGILEKLIEKSKNIKYSNIELNFFNLKVLNTHLYLTYLCSIIEFYYKNIYKYILKFSDKKEKIIKNSNNMVANELIKISSGEIELEDAIIRNKSFQNVEKICIYFKELGLNIKSLLDKPYKDNINLYKKLNEIFERRHDLIHELDFDLGYKIKDLENDIECVKEIFERTYKYLSEYYKWNY